MPFKFETYDSPYLSEIIRLMNAGPNAHAQALRTAGQAEAQAALQRGQGAAQIAQSIGQAGQQIAQVPQQIQKQKADQLRLQSDQLTFDETKKKIAEGDTFKGILKSTPQIDENGVSLYDIPTLSKKMTELGIDPTEPLSHLDGINNAFRQEQAAKLATVTRGATSLLAAGADPDLTLHFIDTLEANNSWKKSDLDYFRQIIQKDPSKTQAILQQFVPAQKMENATPGSSARNPLTGQIVPGSTVAPNPVAVAPGGSLVKPDTGATVFTAPPKQSYQQKTVTLDGKPNELVNFDPISGQSFIPGTKEPIDPTRLKSQTPPSIQINNGRTNPQGDWNQSGPDFLASIPLQWRKTVEKIASYDEDPTKVASMRGGMRETLMQWVNQVNPAYDQSSFAIRNPTRKAFTTGTQGQQITAMNTAIEHLDMLQTAADALANGSFKPGNAAYNYLRDTFGSAMPSNYDTIKNMVDKEVEAVANKGVPTVSGTAEQKALAGTSASPAAIKGYINTLIPLMGSKLNALHYQYTQAMGADDPWKPLTPQSEAILQKRGVKAGQGPATATPSQAATIEATDTDGNIHHAAAGTPLPAGWKLVKK